MLYHIIFNIIGLKEVKRYPYIYVYIYIIVFYIDIFVRDDQILHDDT